MSVHSPQGAPPPPPPPGPPPGYTPPPPAKKGLGPLAWVGIGCGVLIVLALAALFVIGMAAKNKAEELTAKYGDNPELAAVEALVALNPEFEKVSSDPEAKTITVRNKSTGEEMTLNFEDIKDGRWEVTTKEGTTSVGADGVRVTDPQGRVSTYGAATGDLPAWVPAYPNAGSPEGVFASDNAEGKTATFTISTADPVDQVLTFYKDKLDEGGFTTTRSTYGSGDAVTGTVTGASADEKRTVNVLVSRDGAQTQAVVTYTEKP